MSKRKFRTPAEIAATPLENIEVPTTTEEAPPPDPVNVAPTAEEVKAEELTEWFGVPAEQLTKSDRALANKKRGAKTPPDFMGKFVIKGKKEYKVKSGKNFTWWNKIELALASNDSRVRVEEILQEVPAEFLKYARTSKWVDIVE